MQQIFLQLCCFPDAISDAGAIAVGKNKNPSPFRVCILVRDTDNKQDKNKKHNIAC